MQVAEGKEEIILALRAGGGDAVSTDMSVQIKADSATSAALTKTKWDGTDLRMAWHRPTRDIFKNDCWLKCFKYGEEKKKWGNGAQDSHEISVEIPNLPQKEGKWINSCTNDRQQSSSGGRFNYLGLIWNITNLNCRSLWVGFFSGLVKYHQRINCWKRCILRIYISESSSDQRARWAPSSQ